MEIVVEPIPYSVGLTHTLRLGYLENISKTVLISLFGEPYLDPCDKTKYEWHVLVNGVFHSIYDFRGHQWSVASNPDQNYYQELIDYITDYAFPMDKHDILWNMKTLQQRILNITN